MKNHLTLVLFLLLPLSLAAQTPRFGWATSTGGTREEIIHSITIHSNDAVYATGSFESVVDFDPRESIFELTAKGDNDMFIQKIDLTGKFLWAKSFGGEKFMAGRSIVADRSGNVYVCGWYDGTVNFGKGSNQTTITAKGSGDIFVLKLDAQGNFIWVKSFGDSDSDIAYTITLDQSENLLISGWFRETIDFDPGIEIFNLTAKGWSDSFVLKLDSAGNFLWAGSMGGPGGDAGHSLVTDSDNNVIVSSYFSRTADMNPGSDTFNVKSNGSNDIAIVKLDSAGRFLWAKTLGGQNSDRPVPSTVDSDGNIYVAGIQQSDFDFDPGPETYILKNSGHYLLKLDPAGNFLWAKSLGGATGDTGYSIATDQMGDVYLTGAYSGVTNFSSEIQMTSKGKSDGFVMKFNARGELAWVQSFGGTTVDRGRCIALDQHSNVYVGGYFWRDTDLYPGAPAAQFLSNGRSDFFILKLKPAN